MSRRNSNKRQPAGRIKRNVRRHPPMMSTRIFQRAAAEEHLRELQFLSLFANEQGATGMRYA